jgi:hypothetical protein
MPPSLTGIGAMIQNNPHWGMSSYVSYPPVDVGSKGIHDAPKIANAPTQKTRLHVFKPIAGTRGERDLLPIPWHPSQYQRGPTA